MKHRRQGRYSDGFFDGILVRCSICRTYNRTDRAPQLGSYSPPSVVNSTDSVTGKSNYDDNASSRGCMFCGTPLLLTGKRQDLGRWVP